MTSTIGSERIESEENEIAYRCHNSLNTQYKHCQINDKNHVGIGVPGILNNRLSNEYKHVKIVCGNISKTFAVSNYIYNKYIKMCASRW
mgnify:CR=1 FL=1